MSTEQIDTLNEQIAEQEQRLNGVDEALALAEQLAAKCMELWPDEGDAFLDPAHDAAEAVEHLRLKRAHAAGCIKRLTDERDLAIYRSGQAVTA